MRKILFQGKETHSRKWIEGIYLDENNLGVFCDDTESEDCQIYIFPIIRGTARQYIGITDKNNKKVFEGDILCFEGYSKMYVAVEWITEQACWGYMYHGDTFQLSDILIEGKLYDYVVGNIYDNPELLKGE